MPSCAPLAYACIDVGSNTTRLLVAELRGGGLRELATQRAFTRLGKGVLEEMWPPVKRLLAGSLVSPHVELVLNTLLNEVPF